MLEYAAGLLEWIPIWPLSSGHLAGLPGIYLVREGLEPKAAISALVTSSLLTFLLRGWLRYVDPPVGGLIVAGLSFIGLLAVIFLKWGLLAVDEGRQPDSMDGFVSGFAQGMSSLGFGGSGLSMALLTSSGVSVKGAVSISSIASIPPVVAQLALDPPSPVWIIVLLEGAVAVFFLTRVRMRPSNFGFTLSLALMANLYQIRSIGEHLKHYQSLGEEISSFVRKYGAPGLFAAMVLQAVISPIPADAILVAAGALGMDPIEVGIYGGMGIAVGSVINYFIARAVGKRILEYYIREDLLRRVYFWFDRWGGWLVFITRLIPFLPLDITSYVAGAVGMNFIVFFLANVLAIVPRATFFGLVGARLAQGDWTLLAASLIMLLVGAYIFSRQVIRGGRSSDGDGGSTEGSHY